MLAEQAYAFLADTLKANSKESHTDRQHGVTQQKQNKIGYLTSEVI